MRRAVSLCSALLAGSDKCWATLTAITLKVSRDVMVHFLGPPPVLFKLWCWRVCTLDPRAKSEPLSSGIEVWGDASAPCPGGKERRLSPQARAARVKSACGLQDVMLERLMERAKSSGRSDDNLDSINKRFKTFEQETLPVARALCFCPAVSVFRSFSGCVWASDGLLLVCLVASYFSRSLCLNVNPGPLTSGLRGQVVRLLEEKGIVRHVDAQKVSLKT